MKKFLDDQKYKKMIVAFWVTLIITISVFIYIFISFGRRLRSTADIGLLTINTTKSVVPNDNNDDISSTSFSDDRTINEVSSSVLNQIEKADNGKAVNVASAKEIQDNKVVNNTLFENKNNKKINETESVNTEKTEVLEEKLEFIAPVSGEIITDYADTSLVYSKTLDEWTTHLGIDIKANKTSAVIASENGTVKSIKNDPRYGLSITISHNDGYETVYSNLLSADFVKEGDSVKKGDTIGTVGESSSFEIAETPHLHFEMYKDGENINPTSLLK